MPEIGKKAPDFTLSDQAGNKHKLSDYEGKKIALYFYPKDNTSGCTREACSFRDDYSELKKKGIVVLGVSIDSEGSHRKFIDKYDLPFTLLADPEKKVVEKYGVWVEKSMYGRKYMGTARKTFLVDETGKIVHIFEKVKVAEHAREVLNKFAEL